MATALWHKAEAPVLNDMDGDALVILDCCMASAAIYKNRSPGSRIYQLLAASAEDLPTRGPGPNSFTTALCDSLEELVKESGGKPFLLTQLCEQINRKRKTQPCVAWDCLRSYKRSVQLGPLHETQQERKAAFQKNEPEKASITLRLSLKDNDLEDGQIRKLAEQLPRICHETKIPLQRIYWEGMTAQKREVRRTTGFDNDELSEVAEDHIREAAFAFRSAVRRKQENRGLFLCTSDLAILSAIMAGSLFCKVTKERYIVLAAGAAVMLACKMQKLGQGLERKRGRDGTHNLYRVLQSRIASLFPSNE
jgi:hypothetical protein